MVCGATENTLYVGHSHPHRSANPRNYEDSIGQLPRGAVGGYYDLEEQPIHTLLRLINRPKSHWGGSRVCRDRRRDVPSRRVGSRTYALIERRHRSLINRDSCRRGRGRRVQSLGLNTYDAARIGVDRTWTPRSNETVIHIPARCSAAPDCALLYHFSRKVGEWS
jgi:hypothetical protein